MKEAYFIEHNGENWQSVFPSAQSEKSQLHETIVDALDYMIQECGLHRTQIRVIRQ